MMVVWAYILLSSTYNIINSLRAGKYWCLIVLAMQEVGMKLYLVILVLRTNAYKLYCGADIFMYVPILSPRISFDDASPLYVLIK